MTEMQDDTNDLTREKFNRRVYEAAEKAALWSHEAGDDDHFDLDEAAGEAMNEVWGEDYRTHRGRILDYAARLPSQKDFGHIREVHAPESTGEFLDYLAREALHEEIANLAWHLDEFGGAIRERESEERRSMTEALNEQDE